MDFRLLGPLEVLRDGRPIALGGAKQRSLVAVLLLHANQLVSADRLIDELWGDEPPATAAKTIQVYVSRLRKELDDDRLLTRSPGYVLRVEPGELDLERFERLFAETRRADPRDAGQKLRAALSLWRGRPLADLAYEPFAQTHVARLEELWWAALEQRIEADLADGRHAELIAELESLSREQPLREVLRGQLMLSLYRSGRQAEALQAYQEARRALLDELGLEPSAALRRLEQAILEQDPGLALPDEAEEPVRAPAGASVPARAILVAPSHLDALDSLLALAEPLAVADPPHELIVAAVVAQHELAAASERLAARRAEMVTRGVTVRGAAFSSPTVGADVARLAAQEEVDLLLTDARGASLEADAIAVLEQAPCDVALLAGSPSLGGDGPVIVPFGAAWHDWAALELGAWAARAMQAPLRLAGAASNGLGNARDASRLLADASLIVQRQTGIMAEPALAPPGRKGLESVSRDGALLVVGLSERWRDEGLGRVRAELVAARPSPTLLVRRGPRPGGLAPAGERTRFGWSLTAGPA